MVKNSATEERRTRLGYSQDGVGVLRPPWERRSERCRVVGRSLDFGQGAELRPRLLALVQERLAAVNIALVD